MRKQKVKDRVALTVQSFVANSGKAVARVALQGWRTVTRVARAKIDATERALGRAEEALGIPYSETGTHSPSVSTRHAHLPLS